MSRLAVTALLAVALVAALGLLSGADGSTQRTVSLAVDADPSGNTAAALGATERCLSVRTGDAFSIDIVVVDVTDLIGFSADLVYDPSILTVVDRAVDLFLGANSGSNVFDASAAPPGQPGLYHFGGADIADPPLPTSGSGVLARLTLQAQGPGVSPAAIPRLDLNGDGTVDIGPILADVSGRHIDDEDGDGYFDGRAPDAWVAVDSPCPDVPPTVFPTPPRATATPLPTGAPTNVDAVTPTVTPPAATEGSDDPPWAIIGVVAGGGAVVVAGAFVWWRFGRRSH